MFKNLIKLIKDSFVIKESFFICEQTKFHPVVNELSNNFFILKVVKLNNWKVQEQVILSEIATLSDAQRHLKAYKEVKAKEKSEGYVFVKDQPDV